MAVLQVENLTKKLGNTQVLKGVSFSLEQGQVLAIIGASGSGKTTLLRCLNFLEEADSGRILVDGKPLAIRGSSAQLRQSRQSFGLVFQNFHLFPQYNALENLLLAPMLQKQGSRRDLERQAMALLEQVGLSDRVEHYPWQLSGGQQQRLAIARALMRTPRVLCFDEPTSALDPELTGEVLRVIRKLKSTERTMIVVTHEMAFAKSVADVVIYMAEGVIVEMGTPQQIFTQARQDKTRAFIRGLQDTF